MTIWTKQRALAVVAAWIIAVGMIWWTAASMHITPAKPAQSAWLTETVAHTRAQLAGCAHGYTITTTPSFVDGKCKP